MNKKKKTFLIFVLMTLVLLFMTWVRLRLSKFPLERDEGEYAYFGQLILQGIPPYDIAYNLKLPGTCYFFAFFLKFLGETTQGIHIGLLIMNIAATLLLFDLTKKIVGRSAALFACTTFAVLVTGIGVWGFAAHATQYLLVPMLAGMRLLYSAIKTQKKIHYFWSGICLGIAMLVKQSGVFFLLAGGIMLIVNNIIFDKKRIKNELMNIFCFTAGGLLPLLLLMLYFKIAGVFDTFWFWTVEYAGVYGNKFSFNKDIIQTIISTFTNGIAYVINDFYLVWIWAGVGLLIIFLHPSLKSKTDRLFLYLFFIFSFATVWPGYLFRSHYFVTLLPIVAILFSITIDYAKLLGGVNRYIAVFLFSISLFIGIVAQRDYYFYDSPATLSQKIYPNTGFAQSPEIGQYIETNSLPQDKIAIFGSEPQILFYAKRRGASGYLHTYSLMEPQMYQNKMKKEMILEIEKTAPRFFVVINTFSSWLSSDFVDPELFDWAENYLRVNDYTIKGIIEINTGNKNYHLNTKASNQNERIINLNNNNIIILKKEGP